MELLGARCPHSLDPGVQSRNQIALAVAISPPYAKACPLSPLRELGHVVGIPQSVGIPGLAAVEVWRLSGIRYRSPLLARHQGSFGAFFGSGATAATVAALLPFIPTLSSKA